MFTGWVVLCNLFWGEKSLYRKNMINMLSLYNMCLVINILSMYFNNFFIRVVLLFLLLVDIDN